MCQHVISFDSVVAKIDRISHIRGVWGYGLGDPVLIPNSDRNIFPRHRIWDPCSSYWKLQRPESEADEVKNAWISVLTPVPSGYSA